LHPRCHGWRLCGYAFVSLGVNDGTRGCVCGGVGDACADFVLWKRGNSFVNMRTTYETPKLARASQV
jgi:hypothetical protein